MTLNIFSGDNWSDDDLKQLLKKLEQMYASGVRQSTFKDQTLIYATTAELKERINDIRLEIDSRTSPNSPVDKKVIRFTTRSRGF